MKGINNIIKIPTSLQSTFFEHWLNFLRPLHNLNEGQIRLLAAFIKERYELSKKINDQDYLDTVLMSVETRKKIRLSLDMKSSHFNILMYQLKQSGVIVNDKINPKLIPNITDEKDGFKLLLLFDLQ